MRHLQGVQIDVTNAEGKVVVTTSHEGETINVTRLDPSTAAALAGRILENAGPAQIEKDIIDSMIVPDTLPEGWT